MIKDFQNPATGRSILFSLLLASLVSSAQAESTLGAPAISQIDPAQKSAAEAGSDISSLTSPDDHKAIVFSTQGEVKVLKRDAENWVPAAKEMILEAGDQIFTGKGAFIEFAYDPNFLNIARIEENTKAEFRSIEPTELYLEDGTVFNALDGLNGSNYQIMTPTAVAGVRGTHFDATYIAATEAAIFSTLPVSDGRESLIVVSDILKDGTIGKSVEVPEGAQIDLAANVVIEDSLVKDLDSTRAVSAQNTFEQMSDSIKKFQESQESSEQTPADLEDSDTQKKGDDGGNPPGGSGGDIKKENFSGFGLMNSSTDSMVDRMIFPMTPLLLISTPRNPTTLEIIGSKTGMAPGLRRWLNQKPSLASSIRMQNAPTTPPTIGYKPTTAPGLLHWSKRHLHLFLNLIPPRSGPITRARAGSRPTMAPGSRRSSSPALIRVPVN